MKPLLCTLALALLAGCTCAEPVEESAAPTGTLVNGWSPVSGRGDVQVDRADGSRVELRFHDGFEGYTGGLVLGSQNGPAFRYWPPGVDPESKPLAIWCAQDESLRDRGRDLEYSWGWSENLGTGPGGVPLRFLRGAVIGEGDDGVTLVSEHAAEPLHVVRRARIRPDATVLMDVRFTNTAPHPFAFDLWTGDDPWVGEYGTAEGDRGWAGDAVFENERSLEPGSVGCLGVVDRSVSLGEATYAVANAFCLSPATPQPDQVHFANRFAHGYDDVHPSQPLEGSTMTAFNLGWVDRELGPGETLHLGYALGLADASGPSHQAPLPPPIEPAEWEALAAVPWEPLAEELTRDPLRFAWERVEMEVLPGLDEVEIRGLYRLQNRSDEPNVRRIFFPFAVDEEHPYPGQIRVSTGEVKRLRDGVVFGIEVPASGELEFEVTYRQRTTAPNATYIVTSARAWNDPLDQSILVVMGPEGWAPKETSFPMVEQTDESGRTIWVADMYRFFPDRELFASW